jgi:hypothetical protein
MPRILKGSALAYGLVIMTAVAILMTSIVTFITAQTKYALQNHAKEQAFQIAESGIQFYRWYLAHTVEGKTATQVADFWAGSPYGVGTPYEAEYSDTAGPIGKYQIEVTPPQDGSTVVLVTATAWTYRYPSVKRVIKVRFRKPAWSEDIVLANDVLRFGEGTETFGKIHSNQGIRFDGVAHNVVSSAVASYDDPDHSGGQEFGVHTHVSPVDPLPPASVPERKDVFEGGRSFPVASTDFTGVLGDLSYMKSEAQAGTNGSLYFDDSRQGRHIILNADGTFQIRTVRSFSAASNEINSYSGGWQSYPIPQDGIIFVENNVWLEGDISDKRVTVVAANLRSSAKKSVYIGHDITYADHTCDNILGIVGQKDIEMTRDSEDDLHIDAALLAQTGRVGREHYGGQVDHKDTITVYGAIATNERYGFAWTDGTGYENRNLYYDNNLLYCPPPYFPSGTQYEMDLWEEE